MALIFAAFCAAANLKTVNQLRKRIEPCSSESKDFFNRLSRSQSDQWRRALHSSLHYLSSLQIQSRFQ